LLVLGWFVVAVFFTFFFPCFHSTKIKVKRYLRASPCLPKSWFLHDLDEFSPFALRTKVDDTFPRAENGEGNW